MIEGPLAIDPFDVRLARGIDGLLKEFNHAGVLSAADVHVARRLAELADESSAEVALAVALAVRGPQFGHVFVDLATIHDTVAVEAEQPTDLSELPWPSSEKWLGALENSRLVASGESEGSDRPIRLIGEHLYLDRYWRQESALAANLRDRSQEAPAEVDLELLHQGVARLFPDQTDSAQAVAAAAAVLRQLAVIAGGPGTGKTTTVARVAALVLEQAEEPSSHPPLIALAAPTGKASARLKEAVNEEAARLQVSDPIREHLLTLEASTLHRLLGSRPGTGSRFRHDANNRLPHDAVIVDEASMVSLPLMASLVAGVRPAARLILIGDPGQLTSVEAGAVLGDIVGPAVQGLRINAPTRDALAAATGHQVDAEDPPAGVEVGDGIVMLDRVHRFGEEIGSLANAIRIGDGDGAMESLGASNGEITWIDLDAAEDPVNPALNLVKERAQAAAGQVIEAALKGAGGDAIQALARFRLLCAHRRGASGVSTWLSRLEAWLGEAIDGFDPDERWYVGRPLLVTQNDYSLEIFNGDTGVVVAEDDGVAAAFERGDRLLAIRPSRLEAVETAYAMTIHKSQGSQFDTAAVVLPSPDSRILTRELLYTAVTRARRELILIGTEESIRAAVGRPVSRASGLRQLLWGPQE
jgi:exodeoxyribonuclease V alpha subunit